MEISRVVKGVCNVTGTHRDHVPVLEEMCSNDQRDRIESSEINMSSPMNFLYDEADISNQ